MDVCTKFKDIRFNYEDGLKVYRRGIITKTQIATAEDFIYVNSASYPIAKKFNSIIDIDVKSNDEWKHVNYGDYDNLFKVFNEEEADSIAPSEEDDDIESVEDSREYDPEIDNLPSVDEEIVDTARTEAIDANELKELSDATDAIENTEEEVVENAVESNTEDNTDNDIDQESVTSEVEPFTNNNQNNKYSFKKKKRHS